MLNVITDLPPKTRRYLYDLFTVVSAGIVIASLYGFDDPRIGTIFGIVSALFGYTARTNTDTSEPDTDDEAVG